MKIIESINRHRFLFEELVKRDFKQKYSRTILGMGWSMIAPLLNMLVMRIVFTQFFGRNTPFYTTYLLAGNVLFSYFSEATRGGMNALMLNRHIFSKIKVPKYLFLLSKNVSSLINLGLTMVIFLIFAAIDGVTFTWKFLLILYPVFCLMLFSVGVGMILSALYIFFRDIQYLYDVFLQLLMYMSAIFYTVDHYPLALQRLLLCNPVYACIRYVRVVTLHGVIPSLEYHALLLFYALAAVALGLLIYKKNNQKFLYYV